MEQKTIYHLLHQLTRVAPCRVEHGRTRGIALENAHITRKLSVHIPDGRTSGSQYRDVYNEHSVQDASEQNAPVLRFVPTKEEALEHPYPNMKKEELAPICELFSTKEFQEKMEALQLQHEFEGRSFTKIEIFTKVLGTKASYVCDLGRSVQQVGSLSSLLSVDLARRLEEARIEIEEMRARQEEYDELFVRQAKMKSKIREQQHLME
ncbi:hypothetical protein CJ030_MR5G006249 [Morella rubra]|uniref:Uncharacterized protein n=1 Tax=Morella rubra TaxID=262757 RepID=A0A6A1VIY4_9ROSI|nr:hypothetical protein CJ030_MR5G006249 [Morella rubra]